MYTHFSKGSPHKYCDEPVKKPYCKLIIDVMPVIKTLEKLDYKQLISNYLKSTGKFITPVTREKLLLSLIVWSLWFAQDAKLSIATFTTIPVERSNTCTKSVSAPYILGPILTCYVNFASQQGKPLSLCVECMV